MSPQLDFVSQRIIDGIIVTAYRDSKDPHKTYLKFNDKLIPVGDLKKIWKNPEMNGIREVIKNNA